MLELGHSGSPGVDLLLDTARLLADDPALLKNLGFERQVAELQSFRRHLEKQFRESLRLYPRNDLFASLQKRFDDTFETFRAGGRRLESFLRTSDLEDLRMGCLRVHQAVVNLQELAGQLSIQEEAWRSESSPGLAGELAFVIRQVQAGAISYQQAAMLMEKILESCRGLEQGIAQSKPENPAVEESLQQCASRLKTLMRILEQTQRTLRAQHSWEIEERLSQLREELDSLTLAHGRLMESLFPPVLCPQCGHQQAADRAQCQSCSTRLPFVPATPSVVAATELESRPRFRAFVDLDASLQLWLDGQDEAKVSCRKVLEPFLQRIQLGRRQMSRDSTLKEETKEAMLSATEVTERVLRALQQALESQDREVCRGLLPSLLEAEEAMIAARGRTS